MGAAAEEDEDDADADDERLAQCVRAAVHAGVPACARFPAPADARALEDVTASPAPGGRYARALALSPPPDADALPPPRARARADAADAVAVAVDSFSSPPDEAARGAAGWSFLSHPAVSLGGFAAGRGHEDVGRLLWPAAPVLAAWCVAHRRWLAGARVLELGAGVGLTGAVAGAHAALAELEAAAASGGAPLEAFASRVTLTDTDADGGVVLANLARAAALNDPARNAAHFPGLRAGRGRGAGDSGDGAGAGGAGLDALLSVAVLDFCEYDADDGAAPRDADAAGAPAAEHEPSRGPAPFPRVPRGREFDVILLSDSIYRAADARGVARALAEHLARDGRAFGALLLPPPRTRFGVDALPAALDAAGLRHRVRGVGAALLGAVDDAPSVAAGGYEGALQLYIVTRPQEAA